LRSVQVASSAESSSSSSGTDPLKAVYVPKDLKEDVKVRLVGHFKSDWLDAANVKSFASILFMFFASISPAISFGALLSVATGNAIGAVEVIVATAVIGIIYAMFSGQPLTIIGSTGPVVTYTAILYGLAAQMGIPFLTFYAWVGLWSAAILFVCAVTGASNSIKYITRFTDEIFSGLIAVIFIYESIKFLVVQNLMNPLVSPGTALLSALLGVLTYTVAKATADFKTSKWGGKTLRSVVGDFGPLIAVATGSCFAFFVFPHIALQKLALPATLATTTGRPWITSLAASPQVIFGSLIPASIGVILLFLDQNITVRIVNNPDYGLKKPVGYHLDMLVLSLLIAVQSLLGLPWMVASTAPSIIHLRSLQTLQKNSTTGAEEIVDVKEQRVTALASNALIGCSILLIPLLKNIPIAVLSGLFLHLGIQTAKGNQFIERIGLLLVDPAQRALHMPKYLAQVEEGAWVKFTLIQMASFWVLWTVKESKQFGIAFPLVILAFVPLRYAFKKWFEAKDLERIDPFEMA